MNNNSTLFEPLNTGAHFSECRQYRYALWRIWDATLPKIMFIGLNPSTAAESTDDPTIRRVVSFAKAWGYGGVYMMNCFPYVSTDPKQLFNGLTPESQESNSRHLRHIGSLCEEVIFAWGNFKEVDKDVSNFLLSLFPHAKALQINKNGSPKHPLYVKGDVVPVDFKNYLSQPTKLIQ